LSQEGQMVYEPQSRLVWLLRGLAGPFVHRIAPALAMRSKTVRVSSRFKDQIRLIE